MAEPAPLSFKTRGGGRGGGGWAGGRIQGPGPATPPWAHYTSKEGMHTEGKCTSIAERSRSCVFFFGKNRLFIDQNSFFKRTSPALFLRGGGGCHGGATTTGPDATHPSTIFQNSGGGVQPGVGGGGSSQGSGGGSCQGSGRVWPGVVGASSQG